MNIKKYLEGKPITEAEYKGRKVSLNKPFRTPGGPKKFSVYVKNEKGNVVKVNFGDPNMRIKRNSPERRKSFRARHKCDTPGPKTKARYWSCQAGWNKTKSVKDLIKEEYKSKSSHFRWEDTYKSEEQACSDYMAGVNSSSGTIQIVDPKISCYYELCKISVSKNWSNLKFISGAYLENYDDICLIAIKQDESAFRFIEIKFVKSNNLKQMYNEYHQKYLDRETTWDNSTKEDYRNYYGLNNINESKTSIKKIITEEILKQLKENTQTKEYENHLKDKLRKNGLALQDVPKDIINYDLLCKIALTQNGHAIQFIDPSNESYYQFCQIAIRQNPYSISLIDENSFSEKELYFRLCERAYLNNPDVINSIPQEYQEKLKTSFNNPEYRKEKENQFPQSGDIMESDDLQEGWRDNITKVLAGLSLITTLNTGVSFAKGGEKDRAVKEYISKKFTGNIEDVAGYTKGGYPVYKKDSPSAKEFNAKYNNAIENKIPSFEYNGFTYQVNNNSREKLDILGIAQLGLKTDLKQPEISNKRYDVPAVKSVSEPEGNSVDNSKSTNISKFNKNKIYDLSAEINNNIRNSDNEWFELPDDYMKYLKSYGKEIQSTYNVKGLRDTKTNKIYLALPKTKEGVNSYIQIFKKYILPKMKGIEAVKTLDGKVVSVQDFLGGQLNELLLFNKDARKKGFDAEQEKYKDNPNAIHYKSEPQPTAKYKPKTNSIYDVVDSKKLKEENESNNYVKEILYRHKRSNKWHELPLFLHGKPMNLTYEKALKYVEENFGVFKVINKNILKTQDDIIKIKF